MSFRRKLALMICPELAGFNAYDVRDRESKNDRQKESLFLANQLREVASLYVAAKGDLPVWKGNHQFYKEKGFSWYDVNTAKAVTARVMRDPACGCRPKAHDETLNLFSTMWPAGLLWPHSIPRPQKSKDAA